MLPNVFDKWMEEVKEKLERDDNFMLIDVREKEEYVQGHIPKAHLIALSDFDSASKKILKDQAIYVYCRSGQRAQSAVRKLKAAGYREVYNVGGILHWKYELETGEEHV